MASSSQVDVKALNKQIIEQFSAKKSFSPEKAIFLEEINLPTSAKIKYFLVEELVRNDFARVLPDGKVYFLEKKWRKETKKVQLIYLGILGFPLLLGILLILF